LITDISLAEAQQILRESITPLPAELVRIDDAYGRTAAHDIYATDHVPPVAQAAVDGFALHQDDLQELSPVVIKYYLPFGHTVTENLKPGETVGILTGAPVPPGTAAVIPHEQVHIEKNAFILPKPIHPNWNIKQPGEDLAKGDMLAKAGTRITGGLVSALTACGISQVLVYKKPRVAILGLAPHVVSMPELIGSGQIPDSNSPLLKYLVSRDGGTISGHFSPWLENNDIKANLLAQTDLIITVGGTYATDECEALDLLRKWQATPLFWGVKMQPGSHTGVAMLGNTPILCLAGNPAACAVGYELIASRAIRQMQGLTSKSSRITAVCRNAFTFSPQAVPRFLRAKTYWSEDGWVAEILPGQKSSMIHSLIDYNALIEIPEGQSELSAGSPVTLILTGQ
jgi:molybdopterin molybdotransferase